MKAIIRMNKKETGLFVIFSMLIAVATLWNIRNTRGPIVVPDEIGYWASAAFLAGRNWAGVMQMVPYYSYGYGIFLAPLFIIADPTWRYRGAVVLNAILIWGIFLLIFLICKKLFKQTKTTYLLFLAFAVSVYSSYIFNAQLANVETVVTFFFLLTCYLIISFEEKPGLIKMIAIAAVLVFLYVIHQRNLGVILAFCITLAILFFNKKANWKTILACIATLIAMFLAGSLVKDIIIDQVYANGQMVAINDFSGQTQKLSYLFSVEGVISLFVNILGRFFYLGCSTFFLFYWGLFCLLRDIVLGFKDKEQAKKHSCFLVFLFLSVLATIGISALSTIMPSRLDTLFYGRYSEYVIALVLIYGIMEIRQVKSIVWTQASFVLGHLAVAVCVWAYVKYYDISGYTNFSIVGILQFPFDAVGSKVFQYTVLGGIFTALVSCGVVTLLVKKANYQIIAVSGIAAFWCISNVFTVQKLINSQQDGMQEVRALAEEVRSYAGEEGKVYYVLTDRGVERMYWDIYRFQFYLSDLEFIAIDYSDLHSCPDADFVLLFRTDNIEENIIKKYVVLNQSTTTYFMTSISNEEIIEQWTANEPVRYTVGLAQGEKAYKSEANEYYLETNGMWEDLLAGVSEDLYEGTYRTHVNLELLGAEQEALAIFRMIAEDTEEIIYETQLQKSDFAEGVLNLEIPLELSNGVTRVQFQCLTQFGTILRINQLTYERISNEYRDGIDHIEEVGRIVKDIQALSCDSAVTFVGIRDEGLSTLDYWKEQMEGTQIDYQIYDDFIQKQPDKECYIIKRTKDLFQYQELLKHYTILDATQGYFLVTASSNDKVIIEWEALGNKFASDGMRFSARCLVGTWSGQADWEFSIQSSVHATIELTGVKQASYEYVAVQSFAGEIGLEEVDVFRNGIIGWENKETVDLFAVITEDWPKFSLKLLTMYNMEFSVEDIWLEEDYRGEYMVLMYETILGREPDLIGINYWYQRLVKGEVSLAGVFNGLISSPEMENRNLSDEQFVSILYKVCWGLDETGSERASEYVDALKGGTSRSELLSWFLAAPEYEDMLAEYGWE